MNIGRSSFIPRGSLAYMPDSWESEPDMSLEPYLTEWYDSRKPTDGFKRSYDEKTGYWTFQCSLKNYEYEIESFFEILPHFIENIEHLEYFYEEWDFSTQYDLVDGEIKLINKEFKDYRY